MRIALSSVHVDDQQKALDFYTGVLGFEKRKDIPLGPFRWLTVGARGIDNVELLLEPNDNPVAQAYQKGLFEQGIPATSFEVDDVGAEHKRLEAAGATFHTPPMKAGATTIAILEDTCGNLIQIHQA